MAVQLTCCKDIIGEVKAKSRLIMLLDHDTPVQMKEEKF